MSESTESLPAALKMIRRLEHALVHSHASANRCQENGGSFGPLPISDNEFARAETEMLEQGQSGQPLLEASRALRARLGDAA